MGTAKEPSVRTTKQHLVKATKEPPVVRSNRPSVWTTREPPVGTRSPLWDNQGALSDDKTSQHPVGIRIPCGDKSPPVETNWEPPAETRSSL